MSKIEVKFNKSLHLKSAKQLSKNLLSLMAKHGISESDLSRALELPYNTIHRLVSGSTSDPRVSTLQMIADYFSVSLDALLGNLEPSSDRNKQLSPRSVPILDWEVISKVESLNKFDFTSWSRWQPIALNSSTELGKYTFALESRRSMQPRFPVGTLFVIDPDAKPIDGDLVLIRMKDTKECTLKDLFIDAPYWQLQPIIGNSPSITFSEKDHQIIGIVALTMLFTRK